MNKVFSITDFGAVGDGVTDSTAAIRKAAAAAAENGGVIHVPPGIYLSGKFTLGKGVALEGHSAWTYRSDGSSVIRLNDPAADCLIDITGGFGCSIRGVCLDGGGLGSRIHGVKLDWPEYNGGSEEDTPSMDDCRIGHFTGDGVHLRHIWCFSVRHCMLHNNRGAGLFLDGWDGFILDNWFSGNRNGGIRAGEVAASLTITGNRVEWNVGGGFLFGSADSVNITGNFFDRSGGPAIRAIAPAGKMAWNFSVTGNVFRRDGKPDWGPEHPCFSDPNESSHLLLHRCVNWTVTGNNFGCGIDDGGTGVVSPDYGVVFDECRCLVIRNNTMWCGSRLQNIVDLGNSSELSIGDNVGQPIGNQKQWWPDF